MHVCDVLVAGVIRVVTNGIGSNGGAAAAGGHEAVPISIFYFDQFLVLNMDAFLQAVCPMVLGVAPRPSTLPPLPVPVSRLPLHVSCLACFQDVHKCWLVNGRKDLHDYSSPVYELLCQVGIHPTRGSSMKVPALLPSIQSDPRLGAQETCPCPCPCLCPLPPMLQGRLSQPMASWCCQTSGLTRPPLLPVLFLHDLRHTSRQRAMESHDLPSCL